MGWYTPAAETYHAPPPNSGGLSGFLSNIGSEAHSLVTGLAGLGGAGLHDLRRVLMEGATLGHYQPANDEGYLLDNIVPKIPGAIAQDLSQRYGVLFNKGYLDYSGFANQMYQHPLSYALDATAVGDVAANVAKHAALSSVAAAGGEAAQTMGQELAALGVGRTPEELAKFGVPMTMDEIIQRLPAVATSPRKAVPAAAKAGLDILATQRELTPLEKFASTILAAPTKRLRGEELIATARTANPVIRPLEELVRRTFTISQPKYASKVEELAAEVRGELNVNDLSKVGPLSGETINTGKLADWQRMSAVSTEAQRLGIRIERPFAAKSTLWKAANDWYSGSSSVHLLHRQEDMKAVVDLIKPWLDRFPNLARTGYVFLNRLDKTLEDSRLANVGEVLPQAVPGDIEVTRLLDGTQIIRGYHGSVGGVLPTDIPASELHSGGFHFGSEEAAATRMGRSWSVEIWDPQAGVHGEGEWIPVDEGLDQGQLDAAIAEIKKGKNGQYGEGWLTEGKKTKIRTVSDSTAMDQQGGKLTPIEVRGRYYGAGKGEQPLAEAEIHNPARLAEIQAQGYDGALYRNDVEHMGSTSVITFDPSKVSAFSPIKRTVGLEQAPWLSRVVGGDVAGSGSALNVDPTARWIPGKGHVNQPMLTTLDEATKAAANPNHVARAERILSELNHIIEQGNLTADDMALVPRLQDQVVRSVQRSAGMTAHDLGPHQFVDDIRLKTIQDAIDQLETGTINIETILERPYRALRYAYGAKVSRETGLLEGGPSWMELDDAFRNAGEAPPVYFPFISKQRSSLMDYFRSTQRVGYAQASADPHTRFMEGVLLKKGDFIRDPMEAYARRAARGVRAEETYNTMLRMVSQFGHRINTSDELGRNEVVIAPRYLFMRHKIQRLFEDFVDAQITGGADRERAIGNGLHYVMKDVQDEIMNMAADEQSKVEMYAVPRVVADRLNDAQRFAGFGGKWAAFVDEPMKVWRNLVLLGRPAWVLNNLLGNVLFAKMQGASVTDAMHLLENRYMKLINERYGTNFSTKFLDALENLPGHGDVSSGFFSTIGQFTSKNPTWENSALGKAIHLAQTHAPRRALERYGDFVKMVNRELESAFRDSSYLTAIERNAGIGATKRTFRIFMNSRQRIDDLLKNGIALGTKESPGIGAKYALAEVDQFFGNYTRLTPFERHVVRRFIFPWWGFYRHQLKLLLSFPMQYPARAKMLQQVSNATLDMMAAYGPVPDWLQGSTPMGPPGMPGQTPFLSTRGPNPFEGTFVDWTSQLSPPLKVLLERAQGRSSFTGLPFTDKDTYTPYGSSQQYRVIYDSNGFPVDSQPVKNVLPSPWEHLLQQIPQYQMLKQSIAGGRTFDTSSLLSVLMNPDGSVKTDPATGEPLFPTDLMQQLQKLMGFSTVNYDLNTYQQRLDAEKKQVINEALKRMAVAG